ncbi:MAG: hypothetical protein JO223_22650 [Hyphomicrobiales bacterium]|nr:hypothetical protein [Hyphomicrobiales bacterium]
MSLVYELNYNAGTLAKTGDGFGFTYDFVDRPVTAALSLAAAPLNGAVPEMSTWGDDGNWLRWPRVRGLSRVAQGCGVRHVTLRLLRAFADLSWTAFPEIMKLW